MKGTNAMLVFKHSIKYLKDHLLTEIARKTYKIDINDINFVRNVPATWDDTAKLFMQEAAIKVSQCEKGKLLKLVKIVCMLT